MTTALHRCYNIPESIKDVFTYMVRVDSTPANIPCYKTVWAEGCPIPDTYLNGRPVYFGDIEYAGVDSHFMEATYADSGIDLDDDELYELDQNEADYICNEVMEHYGYMPD